MTRTDATRTDATRTDIAVLLERYASRVFALPGVSRTNPHAFAEAKDDLARAILADARRFRAEASRAVPRVRDAIRPGARTIDRRQVAVEVRRRRV